MEGNMKRVFSRLLVCLMLLSLPLMFVPALSADQPAGPVTITTTIHFTSFPFFGTFTVDDPNNVLGCDAGTFFDLPRARGVIEKHFTCTAGGSGTFVILFHPPRKPWNVLLGTGDFETLHGTGSFSLVITEFGANGEPIQGTETLIGQFHHDPD
jgi:hypothetical protein